MNYTIKIPYVAELSGMRKSQLTELFNGFKTSGNMPFEFSEMMQYFKLRLQKKTVTDVALELNISSMDLLNFYNNGFKVMDSKRVYSHDKMEEIYNYFNLKIYDKEKHSALLDQDFRDYFFPCFYGEIENEIKNR